MSGRQHEPAGAPPPGFHPSMYGTSQKRAALVRLMWRLVRPGSLVFDIGANIGEHTEAYLAIGCRVVAVEPQEHCAERISERAQVVVAAVAAQAGHVTLLECSSNPWLSTLVPSHRDLVQGVNGSWDMVPREVEAVTLDGLIEEYGRPDFIKLDIEGSEAEALRGLSFAPPALSFEVHPWSQPKTGECLERLAELGDYGLCYSPLESFELEAWPPPQLALFGDVYATLRDR